MNFIDVLILWMATASFSWLIVHATILDITGIRPFLHRSKFIKDLMNCSYCCSFYTGIILTILFVPFGKLWLIFPFTCNAFAFTWERTVNLIVDLTIKINKKD